MRRPSVFKKTDVTRAIKAVIAAGRVPARVEIENGKIVVITDTAKDDFAAHLELDRWIKDRAGKA